MPLLEEVTLTARRHLGQTARHLAAVALPKARLEPVLTASQDIARIFPQPDRLVAVRAARVPLLEAARPLLNAVADIAGKSDGPSLDALQHVLLREVVSFRSVCRDAGFLHEHIVAASDMLCTALDEAANNSAWGKSKKSLADTWVCGLAPHFHKNSEGGVGVFRVLGFLVNKPREHMDLLELMLLILALGFEGLYRSACNGRRVLNDIRMRVFSLVYYGRVGAPSPRWTAIERLLKGDDFESVLAETTGIFFHERPSTHHRSRQMAARQRRRPSWRFWQRRQRLFQPRSESHHLHRWRLQRQ